MPRMTILDNNTQRIKAKPCCMQTSELLPLVKWHQPLPAEVGGKYPEGMSGLEVLMRFILRDRISFGKKQQYSKTWPSEYKLRNCCPSAVAKPPSCQPYSELKSIGLFKGQGTAQHNAVAC